MATAIRSDCGRLTFSHQGWIFRKGNRGGRLFTVAGKKEEEFSYVRAGGVKGGEQESVYRDLTRPWQILAAFSLSTKDRMFPTASPCILDRTSTAKGRSNRSIKPAAAWGFMAP